MAWSIDSDGWINGNKYWNIKLVYNRSKVVWFVVIDVVDCGYFPSQAKYALLHQPNKRATHTLEILTCICIASFSMCVLDRRYRYGICDCNCNCNCVCYYSWYLSRLRGQKQHWHLDRQYVIVGRASEWVSEQASAIYTQTYDTYWYELYAIENQLMWIIPAAM